MDATESVKLSVSKKPPKRRSRSSGVGILRSSKPLEDIENVVKEEKNVRNRRVSFCNTVEVKEFGLSEAPEGTSRKHQSDPIDVLDIQISTPATKRQRRLSDLKVHMGRLSIIPKLDKTIYGDAVEEDFDALAEDFDPKKEKDGVIHSPEPQLGGEMSQRVEILEEQPHETNPRLASSPTPACALPTECGEADMSLTTSLSTHEPCSSIFVKPSEHTTTCIESVKMSFTCLASPSGDRGAHHGAHKDATYSVGQHYTTELEPVDMSLTFSPVGCKGGGHNSSNCLPSASPNKSRADMSLTCMAPNETRADMSLTCLVPNETRADMSLTCMVPTETRAYKSLTCLVPNGSCTEPVTSNLCSGDGWHQADPLMETPHHTTCLDSIDMSLISPTEHGRSIVMAQPLQGVGPQGVPLKSDHYQAAEESFIGATHGSADMDFTCMDDTMHLQSIHEAPPTNVLLQRPPLTIASSSNVPGPVLPDLGVTFRLPQGYPEQLTIPVSGTGTNATGCPATSNGGANVKGSIPVSASGTNTIGPNDASSNVKGLLPIIGVSTVADDYSGQPLSVVGIQQPSHPSFSINSGVANTTFKIAAGKPQGSLEVAAVRAQGSLEVAAVRAQGSLEVAAVRAQGSLEVAAVRAQGSLEAAAGKPQGSLEVAAVRAQGSLEAAAGKPQGSLEVAAVRAQGSLEVAAVRTQGSLEVAAGKPQGNLEVAAGKGQREEIQPAAGDRDGSASVMEEEPWTEIHVVTEEIVDDDQYIVSSSHIVPSETQQLIHSGNHQSQVSHWGEAPRQCVPIASEPQGMTQNTVVSAPSLAPTQCPPNTMGCPARSTLNSHPCSLQHQAVPQGSVFGVQQGKPSIAHGDVPFEPVKQGPSFTPHVPPTAVKQSCAAPPLPSLSLWHTAEGPASQQQQCLPPKPQEQPSWVKLTSSAHSTAQQSAPIVQAALQCPSAGDSLLMPPSTLPIAHNLQPTHDWLHPSSTIALQMKLPPNQIEQLPLTQKQMEHPTMFQKQMQLPSSSMIHMAQSPMFQKQMGQAPIHVSTKLMEQPLITVKPMGQPPISTKLMEQPPVSTEQPSISTKQVNQPPVSTEQVNQPPISWEHLQSALLEHLSSANSYLTQPLDCATSMSRLEQQDPRQSTGPLHQATNSSTALPSNHIYQSTTPQAKPSSSTASATVTKGPRAGLTDVDSTDRCNWLQSSALDYSCPLVEDSCDSPSFAMRQRTAVQRECSTKQTLGECLTEGDVCEGQDAAVAFDLDVFQEDLTELRQKLLAVLRELSSRWKRERNRLMQEAILHLFLSASVYLGAINFLREYGISSGVLSSERPPTVVTYPLCTEYLQRVQWLQKVYTEVKQLHERTVSIIKRAPSIYPWVLVVWSENLVEVKVPASDAMLEIQLETEVDVLQGTFLQSITEVHWGSTGTLKPSSISKPANADDILKVVEKITKWGLFNDHDGVMYM